MASAAEVPPAVVTVAWYAPGPTVAGIRTLKRVGSTEPPTAATLRPPRLRAVSPENPEPCTIAAAPGQIPGASEAALTMEVSVGVCAQTVPAHANAKEAMRVYPDSMLGKKMRLDGFPVRRKIQHVATLCAG